MTRTHPEKSNSGRPEPLGKPLSPAGVERPENLRPSLKESTPYPLDAYPMDPDRADRAAIMREDRFRARELADLDDCGLSQ